MGRFLSPDWSAKVEPVPYAKLDDPQSLNLYEYAGNNPLIHIDADGHCWPQSLCNLWNNVKQAAQTFVVAAVVSYQTYTKTNPTTGQVYSGRTSGTGTPEKNVAARDANHHMNDKGYDPAKLDKSSLNSDAIRGKEQLNIEANGGAQSQDGSSGNAINGISPTNPKLQQYLEAAGEEFGKDLANAETTTQNALQGAEQGMQKGLQGAEEGFEEQWTNPSTVTLGEEEEGAEQ